MKKYLPLLLFPGCLAALPKDASVESGKAHFSTENKQMVIETSDKAIINYDSFDIGKGEKVQFQQPSSSSSVLNRVQGGDPSKILGSLESNGKVFLVNPKGIYFGKEATVNVGALVASSLNIASEDFLKDNLSFFLEDKNSLALIQNDGILKASPEGAIILLAPHIRNKGSILANTGKVVTAAAEHVTLDFYGNSLLSFAVEGEIKNALIEHLGHIQAEEGTVSMSLPIAKKAIKETVNRDGIECGEVFTIEDGVISLVSASTILAKEVEVQGKEVSLEGTIEAPNGKVIATGETVSLKGATIDALGGEILIGGDYQGKGEIPYAHNVFMDNTSTLLANDGGTIVLWSSKATAVSGELFAKGGEFGGVLETSSLGVLSFPTDPIVDTSAPNGKMGSWLLDPSVIQIVGPGGGGIPNPCIKEISQIAVSNINTASSTVTLAADTIVQKVPISMKKPHAGITFQSCGTPGSLTLNAPILTDSGPITITDLATSINDTILLSTTSLPISVGADITIGAVASSFERTPLILRSGSRDITFNGPVILDKSALTATGRELNINGNLTATAISLTSTASIDTKHVIKAAGTVLLNSRLGDIGTKSDPITINTPGTITVGGRAIANLKGAPPHNKNSISFVDANTPCIVAFNQKFARNCIPVFNLLPKSIFAFITNLNPQNLGLGEGASGSSSSPSILYSEYSNIFNNPPIYIEPGGIVTDGTNVTDPSNNLQPGTLDIDSNPGL